MKGRLGSVIRIGDPASYIGCCLENCHFRNTVSLGQIAEMSFLQGSFEICVFMSSDWTFHKANKTHYKVRVLQNATIRLVFKTTHDNSFHNGTL